MIDKSSFLILVSTLAVGGAGGYVAAEKRVFPAVDTWVGRVAEPMSEPRVIPSASAALTPTLTPSAAAAPPPAPTGPMCDDSSGTAGDCPGPGLPTIEGGCGSFATVRCGELKTALKPRVAAAAVDCIAKLTPQERCDAARVHLCGHLALMNSCPDPQSSASSASADASVVQVKDPWIASRVGQICHEIIESCGASSVAPSNIECHQLLSGMNDAGRERTRTCMKGHCFDRGLVGCEAAAPAPK